MNTTDIQKLANDYNNVALVKITTDYAFALTKLNTILSTLWSNSQSYAYDDDDQEPPYDWCLFEGTAAGGKNIYYVYFDAQFANSELLADFLLKYDTKLVALDPELDLDYFDYLIDFDFYYGDEDDDKDTTREEVFDDEVLTLSHVLKTSDGDVIAAIVNGVKVKPVPGRPFLWAGEDGYIYSALSFCNNGAKCRKGIVAYGDEGSRVRKLVPRYNDGVNITAPYARIEYPAFEWEDCDSHNLRVSRLVCSAFHGAAPFEDAVVDHINGDKHNNRPDNLEWVTQAENLLRSAEAGRQFRGKDGRFVKRGECEDAVVAFTRGHDDNGRK